MRKAFTDRQTGKPPQVKIETSPLLCCQDARFIQVPELQTDISSAYDCSLLSIYKSISSSRDDTEFCLNV